jgi:hypothetical protein
MSARPSGFVPLKLRPGDVVEVRSEEEILATLDERGAIDGLPFMPEMLAYCGKRLRVELRADKTCDTINYAGARRMYDTVHLAGTRCDGQAHGGCQAGCLFFWKEAWLKRVGEDGAARADKPGARCDRAHLEATTRQPPAPGETEMRYRCQATDLLIASEPMRWWDPRQYVRDVWSGNVTVMQVVRAVLFRGFRRLLRIGGYRALLSSYNKLQSWRGGTPYPYTTGTLVKTPRETLDLKPGEWVRVKSQEEILATVNERNRNHGLSFDPEMVRYCGGMHRVAARVERIINERDGKMIHMSRDCIILEGAYCRAEYSHKRLFCPRSLYPFWREIWLKRVPEGAASAPSSSGKVSP